MTKSEFDQLKRGDQVLAGKDSRWRNAIFEIDSTVPQGRRARCVKVDDYGDLTLGEVLTIKNPWFYEKIEGAKLPAPKTKMARRTDTHTRSIVRPMTCNRCGLTDSRVYLGVVPTAAECPNPGCPNYKATP